MASRLKIAETPFLYDWFVITLRWLMIITLAVILALAGELELPMAAALLALAAWNVYVSLLAILNRRLTYHRQINLAVDWAVTLMVIFNPGPHGPALWAGLLAMLPAGIYFGLRGSLLAAGFSSLALIVWAAFSLGGRADEILLAAPVRQTLQVFAQVLAANLVLGVLIGLISRRVIRSLQQIYKKQVQAAQDEERRVQKAEHDRMQAFYRLLETLGDTLNFQVVLDTALKLGVTALDKPGADADKLAGSVLLLGEGGLRVGAALNFLATDRSQVLPAERGALREIVQTGDRRTILRPGQDVELARLASLAEHTCLLALPLRRGLSSFGVMIFAHPEAGFFNEDRVEVLETIGHQASIAIQNARQYRDLEKGKARILATEEETRKQLARELHDGPAQSVSAVAMGIDIARHFLKTDPLKADEELGRVEGLARRTSQELRHMLFTLRPLVLELDGLVAALRAMADKMSDLYQQKVRVEADPGVELRLDSSRQTVVFYLAEEAVNNARKHARANQVDVRLHFMSADQSAARLEVCDDGQGFNLDEVKMAYERPGQHGDGQPARAHHADRRRTGYCHRSGPGDLRDGADPAQR